MKARHLSTLGAALFALGTWCVAQSTTAPNSSGTTAPASGQQTGNQTEDPNTHGGPAATTQNQGGSSATVNAQGSTQAQTNGTSAQTSTNANAQASGHTQVGVVGAVLDKSIDSSKVKEGDQVTARTTSDYSANGEVLIPKDSKLVGHVTKASAKSKGAAQSELAIMFDKAVLKKNKQEVAVQTIIQAFAAPEQVTMPQSDQSDMSSPGSGGGVPQPTGGGGGMVGGVANAAGNTVGAVGQAAGGVAGAAGNTAGGAVQTTTNASNGAITAGSQGVLNIKGLTVDTQNSSVAQGTLLTSEGKNVKLESGTQMVVRIAESTPNQ